MRLLFALTPVDMEFPGSFRIKHRVTRTWRSFPLLLLLLSLLVHAQELDLKRGVDPLSQHEFGQIDSVGLVNGSLNVHIPLISYPQRGKLRFGLLASWNSKNWHMDYVPAGPTNVNGNWVYDSAIPPGVTIVRDQALRRLLDDSQVLSAVDRNNQTQYKTLYTIRVGTPDGGVHPVGQDASGYSNFPQILGDGSGIVGIPNGDPNHSNGIVGAYDRDGVKHIYRDYTASGCSSSHNCFATDTVDPNGNTITTSLSGWTDTLGRVIPASFSGPGAVATVPGTNGTTLESDLFPGIEGSDARCAAGTTASRVLNLPGPPDSTGQPTTSTFAFCYANYSYQTAFHAEQISVFWQGIRETSGTAQMLHQIVLPDGSSWLFDYDSYLDLTQITFPTGGYVRYVWVNFSFAPGSQVAPVGRTLAQRISNANDGTGEHIRKYHYVATSSSGNFFAGFKAITVDEAGNEQVDFFYSVPYAGNQSTETDSYQGGCGCYNDSSSLGQINGTSSSQGTLLHSVNRSNFLAANYNMLTSSSGLPQTIQTSLASAKTSKTTIAYDSESISLYDLGDGNFVANNDVPPIYQYPFSLGQQTSISQSDYGAQAGTAGPVLRMITRKYLWSDVSIDPSGNYKASNLIDLLESEVIADGGGSKVAETDYKYDETTPQASSVTTQHGAPPGSVRGNLTTTSRLVSNTSTVSSTATYFDIGMVASRTDQNGNTTKYQYSSNFAGAYLTQANLPDTNGVHHVVSANYDFNTGLQTKFTDQNQQVFTNHYDNMLRLIEADNPDGGKTSFSYPSPTEIDMSSSITTGLSNQSSTFFDGLGRTNKTVHTSAGNATVVTTYDAVGRVASVTNPFYSTNDPTYGTTTNAYDALGRITQITEQDGAIVTTQYNQTSAVLANVDCTTITDEAGRWRKTCSDGLGRLIEVDEPPTANFATPGTQGGNPTASIPLSGAISAVPSGTIIPVSPGSQLLMFNPDNVAYVGTDGGIYQPWGIPLSSWHMGGLTGSVLAASNSPLVGYNTDTYNSPSTNTEGVYYVGTDRHLHASWYRYDTGQLISSDLTAFGGANVSSGSQLLMFNPDNVAYVGTDGGIYQPWGVPLSSAWHMGGLTGSVLAASNSPLVGYNTDTYNSPSTNTEGVYYVGTDRHLHASWYRYDTGQLISSDLTAFGGANVSSGSQLLMFNPDNVAYVGTDGGIYQPWGVPLSSWHVGGLTGSVLAASSSPLVGYYTDNYNSPSTNTAGVYYVGTDQHLHASWYQQNTGQLVSADLTGAGGPNVPSGSQLLMFNPDNVAYVGTDGGIHQPWGVPLSSSWHMGGLTGSVLAASNSPLVGYYTDTYNSPSTNTAGIYYVGTDQHLHASWYRYDTGQLISSDLSVVNVFDSGTVSLSVGGFTVTVCYGYSNNSACVGQPVNTTPAQLASAFAQALNVSASPVTVTVSGSVLSVRWKSATPANTDISGLTLTHDQPTLFMAPAFTDAYVTLYSYDALGNLLRVDQKGSAPDDNTKWRTRTFTYDSLSRLLTATNPESGTINYSHDANGNVLQKASPAPNQTGSATQTISYCYDPLNRVTGKAYSPQSCQNGQLPSGTAVVSYLYDQTSYQGLTINNGIGKLTGLIDQAGNGAYSYDTVGRIASESRTIAGIQKSLSYTYNLDGSIKTVTNPSGAVITYTADAAGRPVSAVDSGNGINYVTGSTGPGSNAAYGADGSLLSYTNGYTNTFAGISNSFSYNKRLQPVNMLATTPSATVFSIGYDFHVGNGDNGNVYGITNYRDSTRNQTFTYDVLNRLTSAQNAGADCTQTTVNGRTKFWGNSYGYDPWGNLLQKTPTKCSAENLSVSVLTNNQLIGYAYDSAGNMTHDATTGNNYSYDQENRITGAAGYTYTYDADGNRVEKSNGSAGTVYWHMSPGIVAESDLTGALKSEYVFFDGARVARKDFSGTTTSVFYYFSDHLKTASVITDSAGIIKEDEDYYPWGGDLQFVNNDSNHYKFTAKERDSETGLDYFGARHYSSWLGRFITPDWSSTPVPVPYADLRDPQSLNQYSYVRNVPTSNTDPDGHCWRGFQHMCNWIKYEVWSDDAHLNQALEKKAQADLKQMREWNITIVNDKGQVQSSDQYFAGKSNQQIVDAFAEVEYGRTHTDVGMTVPGVAMETHHLLPREFEQQFKAKGLDIEDYTYNLPTADHRLKPDGLHTGTGRGGAWNQAWRDFFAKNQDPTKEQILQQLDSMMRQFGLK